MRNFREKKKVVFLLFSFTERGMEKAAFVLWLPGLLPSHWLVPEGCRAGKQSLQLTEKALVITNRKIHLGMAGPIALWIFCIPILNRLCTFQDPARTRSSAPRCFGRRSSVCPDLGLSNWTGIYHWFLFNRNNKSGNYFEGWLLSRGLLRQSKALWREIHELQKKRAQKGMSSSRMISKI